MKFSWIVIAVAGLLAVLGVIAADPALARVKHKAQRQCVDRPFEFSWGVLFFPAARRRSRTVARRRSMHTANSSARTRIATSACSCSATRRPAIRRT